MAKNGHSFRKETDTFFTPLHLLTRCYNCALMKKLKLGIPKGSLQDATVALFEKAGFKVVVSSRSYFPQIDDEEISPVLLRAQEMSRYVEDETLDCGITGADWIDENSSDVTSLAELLYAKATSNKVRWVLA